LRAEYHSIPRGAIKIPVPDTTQQTDYSCGASALQAVCRFYGVGPEEEWQFVDALGMDRRVGSHPYQIARAARRFRLRVEEQSPMSRARLLFHLRRRRPVLLMIQAWPLAPRHTYRGWWKDGHWVVAIGYDREGVYFEDPSLQAVRGFLSYAELAERWHDTGPHGKHVPRYGMAVWKPRAQSAYESRAIHIA
jgi:ABC-type bacteriocin/lantibiotic exporter with double-glycine peptidase domain